MPLKCRLLLVVVADFNRPQIGFLLGLFGKAYNRNLELIFTAKYQGGYFLNLHHLVEQSAKCRQNVGLLLEAIVDFI